MYTGCPVNALAYADFTLDSSNFYKSSGSVYHSPDSRLLSASPGTTDAAEDAAGGGLKRREDVAVSAPLLPALLFKNASVIPAIAKHLVSFRRNRHVHYTVVSTLKL